MADENPSPSLGLEALCEPPSGQPAVDLAVESIPKLLVKAREGKKSYALVCVRAKAFLEAIRDGAVARIKREALYKQLTEVVFAYWAARLHHPGALLDKKREQRIMVRLREGRGDWGLLCYAVDGALRDDWIMGRALDSPRPYDGVETVFRDRAQVERLAELCPAYAQGESHPLVRKYTNGHATS